MSIEAKQAPLQGIGRAGKLLYLPETSFETSAVGLTTNSKRLNYLNCNITLEQERAERVDKRDEPGLYETICRHRSVAFDLEAYLLPSGTAGTPPDAGELLEDIGFTHTNTPATSDAYTLRNGIDSFGLMRDAENLSDRLTGALAEELKISWNGTAEAMLSVSGKATNSIRTGTTTLAAVLSATDTTIELTEAEYTEVGSYVQFGDDGAIDDNSGDGYKITDVNTTTNVITFTPQAAVGAGSGTACSPVIPDVATVGKPICGNYGSITIGGVTIATISGDVTTALNVWTDSDNFGNESYTSNYRLTDRRVSFNLECYGTNVNLLELMRTRDSKGTTSSAVVITLGTTAGYIATINLPYAQFEISNIAQPDEDANVFTLTGKALASSGNDELVLTFT